MTPQFHWMQVYFCAGENTEFFIFKINQLLCCYLGVWLPVCFVLNLAEMCVVAVALAKIEFLCICSGGLPELGRGRYAAQSTRWKLTYRIQSTLSAPLLWWCPDREDVSCGIKGWSAHIFDSSHIINMLGIAYVWFGIYIWQQICTKLVVCPFFPEKWKHCDCSFLKWNCFASKTHENPLWRFTCVGSGTSDKLYKSNDLI